MMLTNKGWGPIRKHLDKAILMTVMTRLWNMGSGLITMVLITRYLTSSLQGYYYTFFSLVGLQVFVEMGLNTVIIQVASHVKASLDWNAGGNLIGDELAESKIQALLKLALCWFSAGGLLLIIILIPVGWYFFKLKFHSGKYGLLIGVPWVILVISTAVLLVINSYYSILEGCGKIAEVAEIRLWQSKISSLGVWSALGFGLGMYALPIGSLASVCISVVLLRKRFGAFIRQYWRFGTSLSVLKWREEILPFQWRISLSWLSGYLIFQSMTPIVFDELGAKEAGKLGMTLQIFNALNGIAGVWIGTKAPKFGMLIAGNNMKELKSLFLTGCRQSIVVMLCGMAVFAIGYTLMVKMHFTFIDRLIPWTLMMIVGVTSLSNLIMSLEASYLRAYKTEPFLVISILNGVSTISMALFMIPKMGLLGAVLAYAIGANIFGLAVGSIIFIKKWNELR